MGKRAKQIFGSSPFSLSGRGGGIGGNALFGGDESYEEFHMWKKFYDGWFTFFYNIETGERKFKLDPGDVLVD